MGIWDFKNSKYPVIPHYYHLKIYPSRALFSFNAPFFPGGPALPLLSPACPPFCGSCEPVRRAGCRSSRPACPPFCGSCEPAFLKCRLESKAIFYVFLRKTAPEKSTGQKTLTSASKRADLRSRLECALPYSQYQAFCFFFQACTASVSLPKSKELKTSFGMQPTILARSGAICL